MEKTQLTPEEKAAQEAAKAEQKAKKEAEAKAKQEEKEKEKSRMQKAESDMREKVKNAFENYPTADKLYHDGEEVFFYQVKAKMVAVTRVDFLNETKSE